MLKFLQVLFITLVVASGIALLYFLFGSGPHRGQSFIAAVALIVTSSVLGFLVKRVMKSAEARSAGPNGEL
jgi:hypothetical protein